MNILSLTPDQMIEVDRLMTDVYGISLEQMLENAGRSLAEISRQMLGGRATGREVSVLCGPGNNGAGGMVAARHLHNMGARVRVVLAAAPTKLKRAPAAQWAILERLEVDRAAPNLTASALIVDALLGYGASGDPRGPIKDCIESANASGIPILSLDTPSGLDLATGVPGRPCIRSAATMTVALPKTGLLAPEAEAWVGRLLLADIGVPRELYRRIGVEVGLLFSEASWIPLKGFETWPGSQNGIRDG